MSKRVDSILAIVSSYLSLAPWWESMCGRTDCTLSMRCSLLSFMAFTNPTNTSKVRLGATFTLPSCAVTTIFDVRRWSVVVCVDLKVCYWFWWIRWRLTRIVFGWGIPTFKLWMTLHKDRDRMEGCWRGVSYTIHHQTCIVLNNLRIFVIQGRRSRETNVVVMTSDLLLLDSPNSLSCFIRTLRLENWEWLD